MQKITFEQYMAMSARREDRIKFRAYSKVIPGEHGFDFQVVPDPDLVIMTAEDRELENAMAFGNGAERAARKLAFRLDRLFKPKKPVLVAEGDSWLQFPILVDEVVDHLADDYAILSLAAAGDTAANMVHGDLEPEGSEYLINLKAEKKHARAFLFSAAGNDIIGEDPATGVSSLFDILNPFNGDVSDVAGHINETVLAQRMGQLKQAYEKVIADVRGVPELATLPILIHGYDYPFPFPWGSGDPRRPLHAKNDEWLGEPLKARQFPSDSDAALKLRRDILKNLIDRLYGMLEALAGTASASQVWVVDCRNAMPDVTDWIDEIHGTDSGFAKVTARFREVLDRALTGS